MTRNSKIITTTVLGFVGNLSALVALFYFSKKG